MAALFGGIAYGVVGAVRAASGDSRIYPANWPPAPASLPIQVDPTVRALVALVALILLAAANVLRLAL